FRRWPAGNTATSRNPAAPKRGLTTTFDRATGWRSSAEPSVPGSLARDHGNGAVDLEHDLLRLGRFRQAVVAQGFIDVGPAQVLLAQHGREQLAVAAQRHRAALDQARQ